MLVWRQSKSWDSSGKKRVVEVKWKASSDVEIITEWRRLRKYVWLLWNALWYCDLILPEGNQWRQYAATYSVVPLPRSSLRPGRMTESRETTIRLEFWKLLQKVLRLYRRFSKKFLDVCRSISGIACYDWKAAHTLACYFKRVILEETRSIRSSWVRFCCSGWGSCSLRGTFGIEKRAEAIKIGKRLIEEAPLTISEVGYHSIRLSAPLRRLSKWWRYADSGLLIVSLALKWSSLWYSRVSAKFQAISWLGFKCRNHGETMFECTIKSFRISGYCYLHCDQSIKASTRSCTIRALQSAV